MKSVKLMLAVVIIVVFTVSVAFAGDPKFSGFFGGPDIYKKMTAGPEGGAKLRWLKPGENFAKYNKLMVDSVIFYLADDAEYKAIDPQDMKDLADAFNKEIITALKDKYPIVSEPGPDVVRVRLAITNIKPSKPGMSAVTSIVPIGLGISLAKKGATGGWTGGGETCAEMMVQDSTSNETIALAYDEQAAAFGDRFSKWGSANEAFKLWSERIVKFLDEAKGIKREKKEK